ncbi:MAG: hypothetical protein KGL51_05220 [Betaproteobacteria bacterium]|nr:hypothetical protein [Betaproteobacteria bacterium]MDE2122597.1 hypothetical protein [Betaproteobacteria bacterium]MDE2187196.1 hypothetical protein [Betaproteobacteria bacterium]MDE2324057.1 hypothetical protein [Betaproteobacteria bacterium]
MNNNKFQIFFSKVSPPVQIAFLITAAIAAVLIYTQINLRNQKIKYEQQISKLREGVNTYLSNNNLLAAINVIASNCSTLKSYSPPQKFLLQSISKTTDSNLLTSAQMVAGKCSSSPTFEVLLNSFVKRADEKQNAYYNNTDATLKNVEDYPEATVPKNITGIDYTAFDLRGFKIANDIIGIISYTPSTNTNIFQKLQFYNTSTKSLINIAGYKFPWNYLYMDLPHNFPNYFFICQADAGVGCSNWSTKIINNTGQLQLLAASIYQDNDNSGSCSAYSAIFEYQNNSIKLTKATSFKSSCPKGFSVFGSEERNFDPAAQPSVLLKMSPTHQVMLLKDLVSMIEKQNNSSVKMKIRDAAIKSPNWIPTLLASLTAPSFTAKQNLSFKMNFSEIKSFAKLEHTYLNRLTWLSNGQLTYKPENLVTNNLRKQINKIVSQLSESILMANPATPPFHSITLSVASSKPYIDSGDGGDVKYQTLGFQGATEMISVISNNPLITSTFEPYINVTVRNGTDNIPVILLNGTAIKVKNYHKVDKITFQNFNSAVKLDGAVIRQAIQLSRFNDCLQGSSPHTCLLS